MSTKKLVKGKKFITRCKVTQQSDTNIYKHAHTYTCIHLDMHAYITADAYLAPVQEGVKINSSDMLAGEAPF